MRRGSRRRMRLKRRKLLCYAVACLLLYFLYANCLPVYLDLNTLARSDTCPACYGSGLCKSFLSGDIRLVGAYKYTASRLVNERNVYRAFWASKNISVVVKGLASNKELEAWDRQLCSIASNGSRSSCQVSAAIKHLLQAWVLPKNDLQGLWMGELSQKTLSWSRLKAESRLQNVDLLHCTHDQQKIDFLVHKSLHHPSRPLLANIISFLFVNTEPVTAMAFPPSDGWPFPLYYGACGRLSVLDNVGETLSYYYRSPWLLRAHFAVQLLEMAKLFSSNPLGLALYPTDWSASNFAVNRQGKLVLIDMENILLVNQTRLIQLRAPGWDTMHTADAQACQHCFSFSVEDLCSHTTTDHNYHGVCGGLLSPQPYSPGFPGGLLHSTPPAIIERHPLMQRLLVQCWQTAVRGGREEAVNLLLEIFKSELSGVDILPLLDIRLS